MPTETLALFAASLDAGPQAGLLLGLLSLPICLWVAYTDLSAMRIRNQAVLALIAVFAVAGPFVLETWGDYAWRWGQFAAVLALGFLLNAVRAVGAGDAKFAAAMAPFVAPGDGVAILTIFAVLLLVTYAGHRGLRRVAAVRALAPGWRSWTEEKDFPMGITLAATHMAYLGLAAAG
jgi:prepilin peptidase CpaA